MFHISTCICYTKKMFTDNARVLIWMGEMAIMKNFRIHCLFNALSFFPGVESDNKTV